MSKFLMRYPITDGIGGIVDQFTPQLQIKGRMGTPARLFSGTKARMTMTC